MSQQRIVVVTFIAFLFGVASISSQVVDNVNNADTVSMNYDFADIFFIKSMTNVNVNLTEYLMKLNTEPISSVVHQLQIEEYNPNIRIKMTDCDKVAWLQCGVQVLNCTHTCADEPVSNCVECLGSMYETCCPCVEELVHKTLAKCISN
jgi:hypothetical protein